MAQKPPQSVYHLRRWHRWQRATIASVARSRKSRLDAGKSEVAVDSDYAMSFVCVATALERDLSDPVFAQKTIGKLVDAYLLRLLQYVGRTSGVRGEVLLPIRMWGPTIFSRPWDIVSASRGACVAEAFIHAGIVIEGPTRLPNFVTPSRDESRNPSRDKFGTGSERVPPHPEPHPEPELNPPLPPAGGDVSPLAGKTRKARPRDIERFAKAVAYVIQCHRTPQELQLARDHRNALNAGVLTDDAIAELLATTYRWVTPERVARWKNTG